MSRFLLFPVPAKAIKKSFKFIISKKDFERFKSNKIKINKYKSKVNFKFAIRLII